MRFPHPDLVPRSRLAQFDRLKQVSVPPHPSVGPQVGQAAPPLYSLSATFFAAFQPGMKRTIVAMSTTAKMKSAMSADIPTISHAAGDRFKPDIEWSADNHIAQSRRTWVDRSPSDHSDDLWTRDDNSPFFRLRAASISIASSKFRQLTIPAYL